MTQSQANTPPSRHAAAIRPRAQIAGAGASICGLWLNLQNKCDSVLVMKRRRTHLKLPRESLAQSLALIALLLLGAVALAGPSGVLAWTENARLLDQRQIEVRQLQAERDRLRNRVNLLDPRHADPDLVGELLRANLNVAHPDELVIQRN